MTWGIRYGMDEGGWGEFETFEPWFEVWPLKSKYFMSEKTQN